MSQRLLFATLAVGVLLTAAAVVGCQSLAERERRWIFQPSDRAWGNTAEYARGMQETWIDFDSTVTGQPVRLHGLFMEADADAARPQPAPLLLYLHGSRWNVSGSSPRIERMQQLGFSVLAIDYRGFGKSSPGLPSEAGAYEDARAAWDWLGQHYPGRDRYIFGHSLGGAIAIELASQVKDARGTIVEGTFTSIRDVAASFKYGWLPIGPFITQRFDSVNKVARLTSPLLVVHGESDHLIDVSLGKRLFDAAPGPKRWLPVPGGSHYNTNAIGQPLYRTAIAELFGLGARRSLAGGHSAGNAQ